MSKDFLKKLRYPSPGGARLTAKDLDRLTSAAGEKLNVGRGLKVERGVGSMMISKRGDLRVRHFQLMTQQEIDSSTSIPSLPGVQDWKSEGLKRRMDYSSSAGGSVQDDILSAWCVPYAHEVFYNSYKPMQGHPYLVYFPHTPLESAGELSAGDKFTAFWNADSGRWEAFKTGGTSSDVKCVITTGDYINDVCVYPGLIRGARANANGTGCKIEEFSEPIWIYFDENPTNISPGFQAFGLKIADTWTIPQQDPPLEDLDRPLYHVCISSEDHDPIKKVYICEKIAGCCLYWGRAWSLDIGLDGTWCQPKLNIQDVWVICPSSMELSSGACDFATLIYDEYTCEGVTMPVYLFGGNCCPDLSCPGVNQSIEFEIQGDPACVPNDCHHIGTLEWTEDADGYGNDGWWGEWECNGAYPYVLLEVNWRRINDDPTVVETGWLDVNPETGVTSTLYYDPDGEGLVSIDISQVIVTGSTGFYRIKLDAQGAPIWRSFTYRYGLLVTCISNPDTQMDGVLYHMKSDAFVALHGTSGDRIIGDPQSIDFQLEACLLSSQGPFGARFGYDTTGIPVVDPLDSPIAGLTYYPFSFHVYGGCKCFTFGDERFTGMGTVNFSYCGPGSVHLDWSDGYYLPPLV